jgi:tetratricopeptide (TPR) repeat protein
MRDRLVAGLLALFVVAAPAFGQVAADSWNRCQAYLPSRDGAGVIGACTSAIESGRLTNGGLSDAFTFRGWAYRINNQPERALGDLTRAIQLDPSNAWSFVQRGLTFAQLAEYDRALQDYDQALHIQPDYAWALAVRGDVFYSLRNYDRAIADYSDAIVNESGEGSEGLGLTALIEVQFDRGRAYARSGDFDRAIRDFDACIAHDPRWNEALRERGLAYTYMKDNDRAFRDFDQAVKWGPDIVALAMRGAIYSERGELDLALDDYNAALRLAPGDPWLLEGRGRVHQKKGEYVRAIADFNESARQEVRE